MSEPDHFFTNMDISENGKYLAAGVSDGTHSFVRLYELATRKVMSEIPTTKNDQLSVHFS